MIAMPLERPVFQDPPDRGRVLLRDGSVAEVRPLTPEDAALLADMLRRQSPETLAFRFLGTTRAVDDVETLLARAAGGVSLVVLRGSPPEERIVAVGSYVPERRGAQAEVALLVDESLHGRGLGTALLERLALIANARGIEQFTATVRRDNHRMLQVFRDSGFDLTIEDAPDFPQEVRVRLALEHTAASVTRFDERDRLATVASLLPFFHPRAIAVVGASRDKNSIGRRIFDNLIRQGFEGPVYPVNAKASVVGPVPAYASVDDLPDGVDVAVVAVPVGAVPAVLEACGRKRIRGVIVITAGFAETGEEGRRLQEALLHQARGLGIRMVGPNCLGIVNTAPDVRMNASFSPTMPPPGRVAMSSQSGALGLALLNYATEQGLGISSFVSVGNKADVSGNDLLQYWEQDPATDVIVLYLESFGNPRRFARLARRVGRTKPVLVVKAARTPAGTRAAASHPAAMASSETAVEALFRQTGVIRADTLEELFDVATLLVRQPLPAGPRVAVVTNAGGPGILATDALAAGGMETPPPSDTLRAALKSFLPPAASLGNPFDMIASASADDYRRTLRAVLQDPGYDAALVIFIPLELADPTAVFAAIREETVRARQAGLAKPVVACVMAEGAGHVLAPEDANIPLYRFPESAARALAVARRYAAWRGEPPGTIPALAGVRLDRVRAIVEAALARGAEWLEGPETFQLLEALGLAVLPLRLAATPEEAGALAREWGTPVAVKMASRTLLHKSNWGGVKLGLVGEEAVTEACRDIRDRLAAAGHLGDLDGFLVQPMAPAGVECMVGVTVDPTFGPLVAFGLGGTEVEVLQDVVFRVVPVTDRDAADMVSGIRAHRLLEGFRGRPPVDREALQDAILRIALLADRVPEIQELDINPLLALEEGQGVRVVDARIRVAPVRE
jgi:acetyl coenzyme A synthetase (ADP forming)-like protein